ncbi:MAG: APC family permease, partial [Myxococcota bacterium]
ATSGAVQRWLASIKVLAVLAIIATSFVSGGNTANFVSPLWPTELSWASVLAVAAALRYAFFAFSGWEGATYVAEEVRNPRRNLPLSLLLGIGGVLVLYLGTNVAYLYQLTPAQMAQAPSVAVDALRMAAGAAGATLIAVAVMINTFGNVSTQVLCKARTWQAMAHDGLFFSRLAPLSARYQTPNAALIAQGAWASLLLVVAAFATHAYETVIDFFTATSTLFNLMTLVAVPILRHRFPDLHRPYRAWLYPWGLIIVLALYGSFFILTLVTAFVPSIIGLGLTATGLIYYRYKQRHPGGRHAARAPTDLGDAG